ncbi:cation:proton antiporter [Candidatus Woesearchaeota archaeon]|nr:cation:proton antiporter [Candidatus Woesearchaeota archaeon]
MAAELVSLGVLFLCAIIGGIIATKFRQPAVFGLLLVGAIIGPNSFNIVQDANMIQWMAEFGAILLLFIIGLEFDISKIMKLGARSVLIGLIKFAIVLFLGYQTTLLLGLSTKVALFIGVILSFSSTVVVVKILEQKEMFSRKEVPLLIAILIIEDIIAVFALTFFSGIGNSNAGIIPVIEHMAFSLAILILAYLVMMRLLRYIVNAILKNSSDESVLTFLSLGMGALFSYFAAYLGLTPSAGAFLAGSLIASLPNAKEYGKAMHPYALIFTSIFFISMGTMVDFGAVRENIALILVLLVVVIFARLISIGFATYMLANFRKEQPFFSSIAMISIGEFSLLIARESEKFNLGADLVTITASIIFISAVLMSFSINYSESLHTLFSSKVPVRLKLRLERISNYMRSFFDQIEIENFFTKKLRSESKIAFALVIITIFVFFILRRVLLFAQASFPTLLLYGLYVMSSVIMLYLLALAYKRMKIIHGTVSIILTHVDGSRNIAKCSRILNNLLLGLLFFFMAMLFPFAIFLFELNVWANLIPFLLAFASFYYTRNLAHLIDSSGDYIGCTPGLSFAKL